LTFPRIGKSSATSLASGVTKNVGAKQKILIKKTVMIIENNEKNCDEKLQRYITMFLPPSVYCL